MQQTDRDVDAFEPLMRGLAVGCALICALAGQARAEPGRVRIGGSFGGGIRAQGLESESQMGADLEIGWRTEYAMLVGSAGRHWFRVDPEAAYERAGRFAAGVRVPFEWIGLDPDGSQMQLWVELGAEHFRVRGDGRTGFVGSIGMDTLVRWNPRTENRASIGFALRVSFLEPVDDDRSFDPGFFMAAVRLGWEGR